MVCLVSFHGILSLEYTRRDHVDKVYQVESEY